MDIEISSDAQRLQRDRIHALLATTYWASQRSAETIERSIETSLCFGAYLGGEQVGFARVITDYATTYYLCDVVVDPERRGLGIGKRLVQAVVEDPRLDSLFGILATRDAHGLYAHFGFGFEAGRFMCRRTTTDPCRNDPPDPNLEPAAELAPNAGPGGTPGGGPA